jgi:hypothetical protein
MGRDASTTTRWRDTFLCAEAKKFMNLRGLSLAACVAAALVMLPAGAQEPAVHSFSPPPPGTVAASQLVYLAGEAMHSQWRAVASKKLVGSASGTSFYQWYLSLYAIDGSTYRLKYQSPANGGPLSKVEQAAGGAKMWFPLQSLALVGAGEFVRPGVQQLVVQSHETGADCGAAIVTIFATNAKGNVVPAVSVRNGCDLSAKIVRKTGARDSILLSGPYYAANAAMCCPTKNHASATLSYANGTWTEKPKYYPLYPGAFPPE